MVIIVTLATPSISVASVATVGQIELMASHHCEEKNLDIIRKEAPVLRTVVTHLTD